MAHNYIVSEVTALMCTTPMHTIKTKNKSLKILFRYLIYIIVKQQYRRMENALLFCNKLEDALQGSISAILEICFQQSTHTSWTKGKRGVHRGEVALWLTWERIPEWYYRPSHGRSYLHPTMSSVRTEKGIWSHYYSLHSADIGSWIKTWSPTIPKL